MSIGEVKYKETKRIIQQAKRQNQLVLFVGAGASIDSGMPTWASAVNQIAKAMPEISDETDVLKIPQYYYNSRGKKEYTQLIRQIFKFGENLKTNKLHEAIVSFYSSTIVTTNYDCLIEKEAAEKGVFIETISCDADLPYRTGAPELIKIHGDFEHDNFVLREDDYLHYHQRFKLIETYIKSIIGSKVVLFIGYSLNDPDVKHIFSWVKEILKEDIQRAYIVLPGKKSNEIEKAYFGNLGVNVIYATDFLDENETLSLTEQSYRVLEYLRTPVNESIIQQLHKELVELKQLEYVYGKYIRRAFFKFKVFPSGIDGLDFSIEPNQEECHVIAQQLCTYYKDKNLLEGENKDCIEDVVCILEKSPINQLIFKSGNPTVSVNHREKTAFDCYIEEFDYEKLKESFEEKQRQSICKPAELLQQAYICAVLKDYTLSYKLLKEIAVQLYCQREYVWYYIAKFNLKYIGQILIRRPGVDSLPDEERKKILGEIDSIDLNRILDSFPSIKGEYSFLKELGNFNFAYSLFYDVFSYSEKANEEANTNYWLFAGLPAYEELRGNVWDFYRYEYMNYIYLDKYSENKSIFLLYVRSILSSFSSEKIEENQNEKETIGNIKVVQLTVQDIHIILRFISCEELTKLLTQLNITELILDSEAQQYIDRISSNVCVANQYVHYSLFEEDIFWRYLELICHTKYSKIVCDACLERIGQIKNQHEFLVHRESIQKYIRCLIRDEIYKDGGICTKVTSIINNLSSCISSGKNVQNGFEYLLVDLLSFCHMGNKSCSLSAFTNKLINNQDIRYCSLLFSCLKAKTKNRIIDGFKDWYPNDNSHDYVCYYSAAEAGIVTYDIDVERKVFEWIKSNANRDKTEAFCIPEKDDFKNLIVACINMYLRDRIIDIAQFKTIIDEFGETFEKWLVDLEGFNYDLFDVSWLLKCSNALHLKIAKNRKVRSIIIEKYHNQYNFLLKKEELTSIIVRFYLANDSNAQRKRGNG